jgi:hypothetical protein
MQITIRAFIYRFLICSILIQCSNILYSYAQNLDNVNTYNLNGHMGVQGGELFSYRLELKDSLGNCLTGYAYTFLEKNKEVKAYVTAQVNYNDRSLHIVERRIIHNHGFKSKALICLVDATLSLDDNDELSGRLTTHTAIQGAHCSPGSIVFSNKAELESLFKLTNNQKEKEPEQKSVTPIQPVKQKIVVVENKKTTVHPTPATEPKKVKKEPDQITEGKEKIYKWNSDQVVLQVWDGTSIDNDKIAIHLNGEEILREYVLTKEKKEIIINLEGNEMNILTITALNEGNEPPNTANLTLKDGDQEYAVIAHNKIGKKAIIKIIRNIVIE